MTRENASAPWLLFEAGAISKTLSDTFVAPVLIGIDKGQLVGSPLSQFQMSGLDKADILQLVRSINRAGDSDHLDEARLVEAFEAFWPDFFEKAKNDIESSDGDNAGTSTQTTTAVTTSDQVVDDHGSLPKTSPLESSAQDFEAAVTEHTSTEAYKKESAYWDAAFAHKRHEFGLKSDAPSLEKLQELSPESFWPAYFLARESLSAGDVTTARTRAASLPAAVGSREKVHYSELQFELSTATNEYKDGLADLKALFSKPIDEASKASVVARFSDKYSKRHPSIATAILRENALHMNPADSNTKFNLAHQLAENRGSAGIAYLHYTSLVESADSLSVSATNNMAVIAGARGMNSLMYKLYNKAVTGGNVLSRTNLSGSLMTAGFTSQAADLLKELDQSGPYGQNVKDAQDRLAKLDGALVESENALRSASKRDHEAFAHFSTVCLQSWLVEQRVRAGEYQALHKGIKVQSDEKGLLTADLERDGKVYKSTLVDNGICGEGTFVEGEAKASILSRSILLTGVSNEPDEILAIVWGGPLASQAIEQISLTRVEAT